MRFFLLFFFIFCLSSTAQAHRVNIYAYVEGTDIVAECMFSTGTPVKKGTIEVRQKESDAVLIAVNINPDGSARFPVPTEITRAGKPLVLTILAGEGHQNTWTIEPEEFSTIDTNNPENTTRAETSTSQSASPEQTSPGSGISEADLERIINRALDAKLTPIRKAVLVEKEPGIPEIVGGIGWIFGLAGIAALVRSKKRD